MVTSGASTPSAARVRTFDNDILAPCYRQSGDSIKGKPGHHQHYSGHCTTYQKFFHNLLKRCVSARKFTKKLLRQ
jgi:hypothetical protein